MQHLEPQQVGLDIVVSMYIHKSMLNFYTGSDFTTPTITVTVPASSGTYQLPQFFSVVDDSSNELDQLFAVVAEVGPDVPEGTSCFKVNEYDTSCFGRRGATRIIIKDNDRKLNKFLSCEFMFTIFFSLCLDSLKGVGLFLKLLGFHHSCSDSISECLH